MLLKAFIVWAMETVIYGTRTSFTTLILDYKVSNLPTQVVKLNCVIRAIDVFLAHVNRWDLVGKSHRGEYVYEYEEETVSDSAESDHEKKKKARRWKLVKRVDVMREADMEVLLWEGIGCMEDMLHGEEVGEVRLQCWVS